MHGLMLLSLALLEILFPGLAQAHAGNEQQSFAWNLNPWISGIMATAILWYALGIYRVRVKAGNARLAGRMRIAAFAIATAAIFLTLESPIDSLAAELFSFHMAQHLALILICAPLFVASRPVLFALWAFPRRIRRVIGRFWSQSKLGAVLRLLSMPIPVALSFTRIFAFWHLPGPYSWAAQYSPVHAIEHLCFFISAFAFWSVVIEPSGTRRLDYGGTLLYVAIISVVSTLPGALMVLTSRPFYGLHAEGAARWGLTLVEDQHLGGLLMWIPGGFAYMAAILIVCALWLRDAERRAKERSRKALTVMTSCMVLLLIGAGCSNNEQDLPQDLDTGGDPQRGATDIVQIGCGACHTIPGIAGATGLIGPPLTEMGRRVFIAGLLRNTPDNLTMWLRDPQKIVPGNVMPDMGLSEEQARDIAAYLYTLR